jgi:hypothetical protein
MPWGVGVRIWNRTATHYIAPRNSGHLAISLSREKGHLEDPASLTKAVREYLGLETAFLRRDAQGQYEFELLSPAPSSFRWVRGTMVPPPSDRQPWHRPGWFKATSQEARRGLAEKGLTVSGAIAQYSNTAITGILILDTEDGRLWLKAVPKIFSHEGPVTRWIWQRHPHVVPEPILHGDGWWISRNITETRPHPGPGYMATAAGIQQASIGHEKQLSALGCPQRPIEEMPWALEQLIRRYDILGNGPREAMVRSLPTLRRLCTQVMALGFPTVLVHGDLRRRNVMYRGSTWAIIDWADSSLSYPFLDLAVAIHDATPDARRTRCAAFVERWLPLMGPAATSLALKSADILGAGHQVISYARILEQVDTSSGDRCGRPRLLYWLRYWVDQMNQGIAGTL